MLYAGYPRRELLPTSRAFEIKGIGFSLHPGNEQILHLHTSVAGYGRAHEFGIDLAGWVVYDQVVLNQCGHASRGSIGPVRQEHGHCLKVGNANLSDSMGRKQGRTHHCIA